MANERVVEIPWALQQLPQSGVVLDVGSVEAAYLQNIIQPDRMLHCLDPRDPVLNRFTPPASAVFYQQSIIGNTLPRRYYDCVLLVSVLEHIGLPCYGQRPFDDGDTLTLAEIRDLLRRGGFAVFTMPAGSSKVTNWYRQYAPSDIRQLFTGWSIEASYWGFTERGYVPIDEDDVPHFTYRDYVGDDAGAGAVAGIVARPR